MPCGLVRNEARAGYILPTLASQIGLSWLEAIMVHTMCFSGRSYFYGFGVQQADHLGPIS
jgi:hypothetical protein